MMSLQVTEKAVKELLFKSTPTQIGSFMLKIDVEPIYIDTFLHILKSLGGGKTVHNLGAARVACYLEVFGTAS